MTEGVLGPDGKPVDIAAAAESLKAPDDVEREFARAMAAPVIDDIPAPPKKPEKPASAPRKPRGRPPKSQRTPSKPVPSSPEQDALRASGVQGLMQLGAGLCLVLDKRTPADDISFKADAVTLAMNADSMAAACVETARNNAQFAAVLDKICNAGPYAALMTATFGIGAQIAVNHGRMQPGVMGTLKPEDLVGKPNGSPAE